MDNHSATNVGKDAIASLSGQIRHADTGTAARLRRLHPLSDAQASLFETERMLLAAHIQARDGDLHRRWALVLHCLAIARGLHDPRAEANPGRVLARLHVSEARVRQLLEADAEVLFDLLPRITRRVASAGVAMNWWPLAHLVLHTDTDDTARADAARRTIVDGYLQAQAQAITYTATT